ncbi:MAG TPA: hypothetical protein VFM55_00915 [Micromonosporaceae bacterium]|nr:hypothetical protein [Micromonosporaceae bacterium]
MRSLRRLVPVTVMLLLALAAPACGGGDETPPGSTGGAGGGAYEQPDSPRGEIWQWALGRDLDDPALRRYTANLKGDAAHVKSEGFTLHFDAAMTVYSVTLFNDEAKLGWGPGDTFRAYRGQLPGGLSWDMTAADVVNTLGQPDQAYTTGYGVELSFTYQDVDGFEIEIRLVARHQRDLWPSPMHSIDVGAG